MGDTKEMTNTNDSVKDSKTNANSKDSKNAGKKQSFFKGLKKEFKKITWPTKDDTVKQTTAVIVISLVVGAIIALLDTAIQYGVDFLIKF